MVDYMLIARAYPQTIECDGHFKNVSFKKNAWNESQNVTLPFN